MGTAEGRTWSKVAGIGIRVVFAGVLATTGIGMAMASGDPVKPTEPTLLSLEREDVDGDGKIDVIAYYDGDGDGVVDSEIIDLEGTGEADIMALRCDGDGDGRTDDWVVVDVKTEEARAMLIDEDNDGEVDEVAYADGSREPVGGQADQFRPARYN
jgi:hypothetical protein